MVSIECNNIFNPEDSFEESVEIMNEGEQEKVLQNLTKISEISTENQNNQNQSENPNKKPLPDNPTTSATSTTLEHPTKASTPVEDQPCHSCLHDTLPEPELNIGCGF